MAIRKSHSASKSTSHSQTKKARRSKVRQMLSEVLEPRQLLAVGPQLIGIQPNGSDLLNDGDVRQTSPKELVFRFDDVQKIDPASLAGIRLTSAGGDNSFDIASVESDFGSNGAASIQLAAAIPGQTFNVNVNSADLGVGVMPTVSLSGNTLSITLNSRSTSRTTASQLVQAVNSSTAASRIQATFKGGNASAPLAVSTPATPLLLSQSNDQIITPGAVLVGDSPNENEVTVRFAQALKDDFYRIEVFGFDDPARGVVGLKNVDGSLFQPSVFGTRKDTVHFHLDLGAQVQAVVPQPVNRGTNGALQQQRDTVVVYFDSDKLLVENDSLGKPTARSVENPAFYQLIYTADTVRNTDDTYFNPVTVKYNALNNTATLRFSNDLNDMLGANAGPITYRLRVGTRESAPFAPRYMDAAATVVTDLNTNEAVRLRFIAKDAGNAGSGIQIAFINSGSGTPNVVINGRVITVDLGRNNLTAGQLVSFLQGRTDVAALVNLEVLSGSNLSTIVGNTNLAFSPVTLYGLGDTTTTAMDLGPIGSLSQTQTSLILGAAIEPTQTLLDLPGASDDAAHRRLLQGISDTFEDHINPLFGADSVDGVQTVYYNFRNIYAQDISGSSLVNSITEIQKQRVREVIALWSNYIGVQFIETADRGVTVATGDYLNVAPIANTQTVVAGLGSVRIDPTFEESLIVLSATNNWGNLYGESFTRSVAASMGYVLGLTNAGDLPETELARFDPFFLAGNDPLIDGNNAQLDANDERYEPIFPGNQDILHAQFMHQPDSNDVDLYRFEVDFGATDRVGVLEAEAYAQRLTNSSELDTNLQVYRETNASGQTSFNVTGLNVKFTSQLSGTAGNQFLISFTQTERGPSGLPTLQFFANSINIDLNSSPGFETTVQDVLSLLSNSAQASKLVKAELISGTASTKIGANLLVQNPVRLLGGKLELIAQNDDYFSGDSFLTQPLGSGVYYIGVSASGNNEYNPSVSGSGANGRTQGEYQLRIKFKAEVDPRDNIQDNAGMFSGDVSVGMDGDADGSTGGVYNFWFQTRPLNRTLSFNAGANIELESKTVTVVGANGVTRVFEFSSDSIIQPGRIRIAYQANSNAATLASSLASAINSRPELGVPATTNGIRLTLIGERSISIDPNITIIDVGGRTIFVDKSAGPNANGTLAQPFNNIAGAGVANAFASAMPGDIVRIVANGGADNNLSTTNNNYAYEIGRGLLSNTILTDGVSMDIPRGVTTMIDAGAIFKLNNASIIAGSTNLNVNRNGAVLQVLGTPTLLDANGNSLRNTDGSPVSGRVQFTSWQDETIGQDTYAPTTTPARGNWGGLFIRRDVDISAGRKDLEQEGIFLQNINYADIKYGGGTVFVDSVAQVISPINILTTRPTITNNIIRYSSSAAISADPGSFEETNFNEPRNQINGAFTSDYDRVGPEIHGNLLSSNSVNGLFISVDTPADGLTRTLTVPGRFDDTDIVHVLTSSLVVSSAVGGSILDGTTPQVNGVSLASAAGGTLSPSIYNYKVTFVDRNGYESVPSDATFPINLPVTSTAIRLAGLPGATGDFISRRLYRSSPGGNGPYQFVANLDRLSSTFLDIGQNPGGVLVRDRLDVSLVSSVPAGGNLAAGTYNYRVVLVDAAGREGLASNATSSVTVLAGSSIQLSQLPELASGYASRRIYRSQANGQGPYALVGELVGVGTSAFTDSGNASSTLLAQEALGVKRPRLNASLVIDPGMVIKLEAARIEAQMGTNIIAEGVDGSPIYFTSRLDDTIGAGGTFDTNDNGSNSTPNPRDWGGIYAAPTSLLSVDHARFSYGGGVTSMDGTFRGFNTIEIQQANARIANSEFVDNANGMGGQGPGTRLGRLSNSPSTVFVRGAQPTIIGNIFKNNDGSAIRIDVNSMTDKLVGDQGRQTGSAERNPNYIVNRGPLIRQNRLQDNGLNGLEIRGGTMTVGGVWDDTDIVHVVYDSIFTGNIQHSGGLRLQSSPTESLVVKFDGYGSNYNRNLGAGITSNGQLTSATDRVGGTLHIVGQPGFPVIMTSLRDDTVGAGLQPDGLPQTDTNADGIGSIPQGADWRGILIDQYSNDRNVGMVLELEDFRAAAPGPNGFTTSAQVIGDLAANASASNENLRLGFVVEGALSQAEDVDVYSFTGVSGSEVWLDVDYTKQNLDTVLELLDASGNLLVRSDSSTLESDDPAQIVTTSLVSAGSANPLNVREDQIRLTAAGKVKEDGTTNINDPGIRVRLPGSAGVRSTFYFRVRSKGLDINQAGAGLSAGAYEVQVRLREAQEWAGSTVNYADIRYAMNGVHLRGMPGESPLIGEAAEDESVGNGQFTANNGVATGYGRPFSFGQSFGNPNWSDPEIGNRPQYLGNILNTAKGAISVAGELSAGDDLDYYMLEVTQEDLVAGLGGNGYAPVVFDMDYADGLNRPDTVLNIFKQEATNFRPNVGSTNNLFQYRLVYSSADGNIADDQPRPLAGTDITDLSRGSAGTRDPFIGPVALEEGIYLVAVSSSALRPRTLLLNPGATQPIDSIRRIVDTGYQQGVTSAVPPVVTNFLTTTTVTPGQDLVSAPFDLGAYSAADLPNVFLTYQQQFFAQLDVYVRNAAGVDTLVASSGNLTNITALTNGAGQISLASFAGQDNLKLVFKATNFSANLTRTIIGFAERGVAMTSVNEPILLNSSFLFGAFDLDSTRTFSLQTYTFADNPSASFSYEIFQGELDVFVVNQFNQRTRIATSVANQAGPTEFVLTRGSPQTALISLNRWVGQPGLRLEFQTETDTNSRSVVSNVYLELADGSHVFSGEPNPTFASVNVPSTTVTTGAYQLEIRVGDNFFESQGSGTPILTQAFDTNDQLADGVNIIAPAGQNIVAGDRFSISDGGNVVVFEFTQTGAVTTLGSIPVRFATTDPNYVVARAIRDAINSTAVQSRLQVRSATSSGIVSGTTGRDPRLNLFGNATVKTIQATNATGEVQVNFTRGRSDRNVTREQGQVLIQNSYIRQSRDYGVWSEPAGRLQDPRDLTTDFYLQNLPALAGTQAVRNLLVANNSVDGGLLPGLVIQNNVLEEGGLGGINISGENPIWMITPLLIPTTDPSPIVNNNGTHFGFYLDDGDILNIDSDRTRLRFEFEDLAGGATGSPVFGSGTVEGNGYAADSTIAWYRDQGGSFYQRSQGGNLQPFATTGLETIHALRDSILGSILVSNGTTQIVNATVADSLMGPDLLAPLTTSFYAHYYNRAALFLEGVTNIQFLNSQGGGNPFDIRTLDLGQSPQPNARVVNNTIIGKDGRAGFNGESPLAEDNETISTAVQTWQGTGIKPLVYSEVGVIGDGGTPIAGSTSTTVSSGGGSGGGSGGTGTTTDFSQTQLLVRFKAGTSDAAQQQILAAQGLSILKEFSYVDTLLVGVTQGGINVESQLEGLRQRPEVLSADPDYIQEIQRTPNDPRYSQQWHYNNVGQTGGTTDADIDLPEAWDLSVGSTQVVLAVLDTGIDYTHSDLRANMWVNPREIANNNIDDDGNGYTDDIFGIDPVNSDSDPMDDHGHGTHVAGTMGAVGNNNRGVTGVNWNTKLMALKVGTAQGGIPNSATIEALNYMVMMKTQYGVNIVVSNNSYGGFGTGSAAQQNAIQASVDAGIVFVAASGNNGVDIDANPFFPASYPIDGIISVAATDHNDLLANFSNFGVNNVDLAAPGVDILSTTLGGGYGLNSGTSMASPHVAGVVGLLAGFKPGLTVAQLKSAVLLAADPLDSLLGTTSTDARLNAFKSLLVASAPQLTSTDVDIYQFKLGTGERAFVNVDTQGSGLQAALQIFDSRGVPQNFLNFRGESVTVSGNEGANGTWIGVDPTADFTALKPGVYYAAVSSVGNTSYDPLSQAGRQAGTSKGAYRITVDARTLQDFVIVAEDARNYQDGQTFTIHGVPNSDLTGTTGVTFQFRFGFLTPPTNPAYIPINLDAGWRFPDVARAIAKAINEGNAGGPVISNAQQLPNGHLGTASPLPAVHAQALGGLTGVLDAPLNTIVGDLEDLMLQFGAVDELGTNVVPNREVERQITGPVYQTNQGLRLFPRRPDGNMNVVSTGGSANGVSFTHTQYTTLSHLGMGHDRLSTTPLSGTSVADGTTEKFIVVKNAAFIEDNGSIILAPSINDQNNLNQLIPETGVLATRGSSPIILNNTFFNVQTPVVNEESRRFPITGGPAPYGSNNPNFPIKPGQVTLAGSIYQFNETASSASRYSTGIEASPTNVPNTALDFNTIVPATTRLFVNAQAGNYLPAPNSPLIDSAIDLIPENPALATVKAAVGLSASPVLTPALDALGQLRTDDPNVAPPQGQGQNVFKDRGALDRADFIGPTAILLNPNDNDALGVDHDSATSVVQLTSGVYPEFRIQLKDGNEPANPLFGLGIDDDSVTGLTVDQLRALGASTVVVENGKILVEGFDYRFAYNSTTDEIILTPLAGVWKPGAVYQITINNRNRFVIATESGDQVSDGDSFSIVDEAGGVVQFQFESGYSLRVPRNLSLQVPLAGTTFGGITDSERFVVTIGTQQKVFEFDLNGNVLAGSISIPLQSGASQQVVVDAIIAAINGAGLGIVASDAGAGVVTLGADAGVQLNTNATIVAQPAGTLALLVPANAIRGGVRDGHTFQLNDGKRQVSFEFDSDGAVQPGNVAIDLTSVGTLRDLTLLMQSTIDGTNLNVTPNLVSDDLLYLGLPENGSASSGSSTLTVVGAARTPRDGQIITITNGATTVNFEFTRDSVVGANNVPIQVSATDTQNQIAGRIIQAIIGANLNLQPKLVGDGNILIGGTSATLIDVSQASDLSLIGRPGFESSTQLQIFGNLLIQVPAGGANGIVEGGTFIVRGNGTAVTFEFDSDFRTTSGHTPIRYTAASTASDIAAAIVSAINAAGLGLSPQIQPGNVISLGIVADSSLDVGNSGLTSARGLVSDGEKFTITNGSVSVTFEFDNATLNNGTTAGNQPILFTPTSTMVSVLNSMRAAINAAGLGLSSTVIGGTSLALNDKPTHSIDVSAAPTLVKTGVPGGATPVYFVPDSSFTEEQMKQAIIDAINSAANTNLSAVDRAGNTLFVSGAVSVSPNLSNFFLRGVDDLAGNFLKPNQVDGETRFTILMPGVDLDFGDSPDPISGTIGRYTTLFSSDGARHVVSNRAILGSTISAELDGLPSVDATLDNDDGVQFGTNFLQAGLFNKFTSTPITVTLNSPGFVDGWIDWNADGDWDDPGEQIFTSREFTLDQLTQTFLVSIPATTPEPAAVTSTYARFRSSTVGGLTPRGLAIDGEVEDYEVKIAPGTPPTAVNDFYNINEDSTLVVTDADGRSTPGFTIDDGVAGNDIDPDSLQLGVVLLQGPTHSTFFRLESNGTFQYTPSADFFGIDTFTYRVNDGTLNSNNIGTVTINVQEVNDAPVPVNDQLTTNEDVTLTFNQSVLLDNDSAGPNETNQTIRVFSLGPTASGGQVSISNGVITYRPAPDFHGTDTFTYEIIDNGTTGGVAAPLHATGTATVVVAEVNDAPTVPPVSNATPEETSLTITGASLLTNAKPGPTDEQAWQSVRLTRVDTQSAGGGTVSWNTSTNSITYIPKLNFAGVDTFVFDVVDFSTNVNLPLTSPKTTQGTYSITVGNTNDDPFVKTALGTKVVAEDQSAFVIDLNQVFDDPDILVANDLLTYTVVSNTADSLVIPTVINNQLTLQLKLNQNGQAKIVVEAKDLAGRVVQDTLTLNVTPVNDAPVLVSALPDVTVAKNATIPSISLTPSHFSDPDLANGDFLTYRVVSNTNPLLVTPTISGSNLNLGLLNNQFGIAVLTISATDSQGFTVVDEFNLTVNNVNQAPVGVGDTYHVPQGTLLSATVDKGVLVNDSDPEGDLMQAEIVSRPSSASQFTLNSNGSFTYLHDGVSRQTDTFVYRVFDGQTRSSNVTVTIIIDAPPPPSHQNPNNNLDVNADGFVTPIDALLVINLLNNPNKPRDTRLLPPPPAYYDVDATGTGRGLITANDALMVINYLNAHSQGHGEGEGEGEGDGDAYNLLAPIIVDVTPSNDNRKVVMQDAPLNYGPLLPEGEFVANKLFATDDWVDLSWMDHCASHSATGVVEDAALGELLDDAGLN